MAILSENLDLNFLLIGYLDKMVHSSQQAEVLSSTSSPTGSSMPVFATAPILPGINWFGPFLLNGLLYCVCFGI